MGGGRRDCKIGLGGEKTLRRKEKAEEVRCEEIGGWQEVQGRYRRSETAAKVNTT